MPNPKNLFQAERQLVKAQGEVASFLTERLRNLVKRVSKRNPNKKVSGNMAMGTWTLWVDGELRENAVFDTLYNRLVHDYGYGVTFTVHFQAKGGEIIETLHTW